MEYRIGIVEDDPWVRESLCRLVACREGHRVLFEVATGEEALELLAQEAPDLLIVDLGLPGIPGLELIRHVQANHPQCHTVVLTVRDDDTSVFDALRAGAVGYLTKDTPRERVGEAIEEVRAGGAPMSLAIARKVVKALTTEPASEPDPCPLSAREQEVLAMLAQGYTYLNVASRLEISVHTVHGHIRNIYKKLQVNSRGEAVYEGARRGFFRF